MLIVPTWTIPPQDASHVDTISPNQTQEEITPLEIDKIVGVSKHPNKICTNFRIAAPNAYILTFPLASKRSYGDYTI